MWWGVCRLILVRGNWAMLSIHWGDFAIISKMHSASRWALCFIDEESNSVSSLQTHGLVSWFRFLAAFVSLSSKSHEVISSDRHVKCWLSIVSLTKTQVLLLSRFRNRNARYTDITISKFKWKKYWYIIAVNKLSLFVILKICHHQKVFMIQTVLRLYLF